MYALLRFREEHVRDLHLSHIHYSLCCELRTRV
jgi:hypothetical protein